jgi:signal peptidase II
MRRSVLRLLISAAIVIATVGCDQTTKRVARTSLKNSGTVHVIGDFIILRYAENQGAFLGLGSGWHPALRGVVFGALSLSIVVGASVYMIWKKHMTFPHTVVLSILIGGGCGNLLDRLTHSGYVTDFMNLGIGRIRTGIFNFADLFLLAGAVIFLITQGKSRANVFQGGPEASKKHSQR